MSRLLMVCNALSLLPRRVLMFWCHDTVLSHLTCASLTEDKYGVVQRDIPKILEAMLSFLSAIEEYQVEINALYVPPTPNHNITTKELQEKEDRRLEVEKAGDTLVFVADGNRTYSLLPLVIKLTYVLQD